MDLSQKMDAGQDRALVAVEPPTVPALSNTAQQGQTLPAAVRPSPCPSPLRRDLERDSYAATAFADVLDRSLHAAVARFTGGLSPTALMAAYLDWLTHLTFSPGKQMRLVEKAVQKAVRFAHHATYCAFQKECNEACIEPLPQDKRFTNPAWRLWPYNLIYQAFLLQQQWWHNATTGVRRHPAA